MTVIRKLYDERPLSIPLPTLNVEKPSPGTLADRSKLTIQAYRVWEGVWRVAFKKNMKNGKIKRLDASLTVEAALSLTLFIFFSICMMMPMEMLRTRQKVQMALETAARDLSQYGYILYRLDCGDEAVLEKKEDWTNEIPDFLAGMAVKAYLKEKIFELAGEEKLENLVISQAEIMEDGENIRLTAEYRLKLPFSVLRIQGIPSVSQTVRRAWIGSDGDRGRKEENGESGEEMVYIGSSMGRYHRLRTCHYLTNDFKAVPYDTVEEIRSHSGGKYYACSVCGSAENGGTVYIMPNGSSYHSRTDCPSVVSYVREVLLREVKYLGACSYCGGVRRE